jgi:hypothetical protein
MVRRVVGGKLKVSIVNKKFIVSRFPNPWDVFVVGGGPAGLATAIAARRHGLSVMLADGAAPPIDKLCGEGLMPDGVEALHNLGITIPEAEAYPFRGIRFVSGDTQAEAAFPRGTAYGIRRTHLHRIMTDHAAACGVHMLWQAVVTGLHPKVRWLLENWCKRAGWWAPTEPVRASAAGQSWASTNWMYPRKRIGASASGATTA